VQKTGGKGNRQEMDGHKNLNFAKNFANFAVTGNLFKRREKHKTRKTEPGVSSGNNA
jgi:hypothetical protein